MQVDAYRLWQHWQQMHYPRRGLPADEAARARLVTLDGTVGELLEPYFCRGRQSKNLDRQALAALASYRRELDGEDLASDASRYFERVRQLIDVVVADVPGVDARPMGRSETVHG